MSEVNNSISVPVDERGEEVICLPDEPQLSERPAVTPDNTVRSEERRGNLCVWKPYGEAVR